MVFGRRFVSILLVVSAIHIASAVPARADVVLDWNAIALRTVVANAQNPFAQARTLACVQVAVFEAVNAVTGDYEPYLGTVHAPAGASPEAAAIAAAHRVLATFFPASAMALDDARAASLMAVADGSAKDDGIAVGEAAAAAVIALRANDGSSPPSFYVPGPADPGMWQATPTCPLDPATGAGLGLFYHWGQVTPFAIPSPAAFMPGPPPALDSAEYRKDYAEVASVGSDSTSNRPPDREDVVRFYAVSSPNMVFGTAVRQIAAVKSFTLSENARNLALLNIAINDALIVSFATKYQYLFWRPETAIRAGDTDGNDRTDPDPTYAPFIATPCFPSYPSNHGSGSTAGAETLRRLYGASGHDITVENPAVPDVVLHYKAFHDITRDVSDARVYGGIHFRFDQDAGERIGRDVAKWVVEHALRPVHGR
jgi:hypothetical protein